MSEPEAPAPVVLVDDDIHAARLLLRALAANGVAGRWLGPAARARRVLADALSGCASPALVIVDLKAHSGASAEFLTEMRSALEAAAALPVAIAGALDRAQRSALVAAGSAAIFARHADRDAYRREVAAIIDFWARGEEMEQVGT